MLYKNKYNKVVLTIILSLYSSCYLSTALAVNEAQAYPSQAELEAKVNLLELARASAQEKQEQITKAFPAAKTAIIDLISKWDGKQKYYADQTIEKINKLADQKGSILPKATADINDLKALVLEITQGNKQIKQEDITAINNLVTHIEAAILAEQEVEQANTDANNLATQIEKANEEAEAAERADIAAKTLATQRETPEPEHNKAKEKPNKPTQERKEDGEELKKSDNKAGETSKEDVEERNKKQEIIQQNRPEVIKVQEKLQIAQAAIEAQTYAVRNIAAIQSSIVSNIINTRMNADQYVIRTPENENKTVAAGSQIVDAYITPASWDI